MKPHPLNKHVLGLLAILITSPCYGFSEELQVSVQAGGGFRRDQFQWTIAGNDKGTSPNILSDLEWTDVDIATASLAADITWKDHWRLMLSATAGSAVSGTNRDSDYDGNNRSGEFSRSYADASDSSTLDAELALGYDFHINPTLTLTPWVGIGYHSQDLRMTDGRQTISDEDDLGPFSGLNSSYDAKWIGALAGLDASIRLTERSRLILGGRFEYSQYEADAVWNLRDDLPTFTHTATGMGIRWMARWEWDFRPQWTLFASVSGAWFETGKGTDRSQFSDGSAETTRMNGATWKSIGIQAGVTYRF